MSLSGPTVSSTVLRFSFGKGVVDSNQASPFVGPAHPNFTLNYRQKVSQFSMQINSTVEGGRLEIDVD